MKVFTDMANPYYLRMKVEVQNYDGSWSPVQPVGYFWDPRSIWLKAIELPFRAIGLIRYDPLIEVPYDEMDFD